MPGGERMDVSIEKTVGIIGGMGPEATVDFMRRIIRFTRADDDIDHVRCLVDNNPKVPSRIKALLEGGTVSPGPCMAEMACGLERWGADFLCIPCNTAHNYYKDVCDAVSIPVLNMIELTAGAIRDACPGVAKAGILASPAVRITKLYEVPCRALGLEPVYPAPDMEDVLLGVIKTVKSGDLGPEVHARYQSVVDDVTRRGAQALAVACTELGLLTDISYPVPCVDAADVLARAAAEIARGTMPFPARH